MKVFNFLTKLKKEIAKEVVKELKESEKSENTISKVDKAELLMTQVDVSCKTFYKLSAEEQKSIYALCSRLRLDPSWKLLMEGIKTEKMNIFMRIAGVSEQEIMEHNAEHGIGWLTGSINGVSSIQKLVEEFGVRNELLN